MELLTLVLFWIGCGILGYGITAGGILAINRYFSYPEINYWPQYEPMDFFERAFCAIAFILGPFGIIFGLMRYFFKAARGSPFMAFSSRKKLN